MARFKQQTTVNFYEAAAQAADRIMDLTGFSLTVILNNLLPVVAQALDAGATWFEMMTAIEAAGQIARARVRALPAPLFDVAAGDLDGEEVDP